MWMAMRAFREKMPDFYHTCINKIENNKDWGWADLMAELRQQAVGESTRLTMQAVTIEKTVMVGGSKQAKPTNGTKVNPDPLRRVSFDIPTTAANAGNNQPQQQYWNNPAELEDCGTCNRKRRRSKIHCKCDTHVWSDKPCWICNPELAPPGWIPRSKRYQPQSSTTALTQQSGLSRPTTQGNNSDNIFVSSLTSTEFDYNQGNNTQSFQ